MRAFGFLAAFLLAFSAGAAFADLYQWQDREGVIHITDDLQKVPEEFRGKVKVFKEETPKPAAPAPEAAEPERPATEERGEALYGEQTLEWWRQNIMKKRDEIQMLESSVTAKTQYIDIFEAGRRFGQTFGTTEVDTYNRYRQELVDDQRRLLELKNELDELRRRARVAGVPREVRGE